MDSHIKRTRVVRAWLRGLTALALCLAVSLGAVQSTTADDRRPPGAAEGVDLSKKFENPLLSPPLLPVFELRWNYYKSLPRSKALQAFSAGRNAAVEWIDPRKVNEKARTALFEKNINTDGRIWRATEVDLQSVAPYFDPKDLADLDGKKGTSSVFALSALNVPGREHSEGVISDILRSLHISVHAKLHGSSERQQCWECANFYHPDTPTSFAAPYDLNTAEVKSLDRQIISIETNGKRNGTPEKTINKLVSETIEGFENEAEERGKQAGKKLDKYIVNAVKSMEDATGKVGQKLGPTFNHQNPCTPGKDPQAAGEHTNTLVLAAAAANPCGDEESPASSPPPTGLSQALAMPGTAPGGIDFSSLQLRYLSDPGDGSGLQYSFSARRTPMNGDLRTSTGLKAARQSSDAFFVWLSLTPQDFWVNLNPDEPDRIVDDRLGRTDAGRVLLEADLRMKKTVGELIHPHSALGRKFWDGVQGDCLSFRNWILPAPASVHQEGDKLYILDAPLDVKMETQYLAGHGQSSARSCPQQDQATEDHNEEHFRSLILPSLKKAINTAPEYAALRRVYLARVAAQWYRDLSRTGDTTYGDLIDSGDIDAWRTTDGWKPTDTFDRYVDSYTKGEFKVTDRTTRGNTTYVRTYVYGGVDLTDIPMQKVPDERFTTDFAGLPQSVDRSLTAPSAADGDETVWLGSPTQRRTTAPAGEQRRPAGLDAPEEPVSPRTWTLRLLPA
ncbi:MAG: hypothetical protein HOZ81_41995, partial [Streptomyces sp.]|nr:hypothetical protein [Streptomyces sp.]